ncbi:hypothetical protein C8F04DRAFT_1026045 [Mycena alexandri]|uniref:BTB domain-containing protein n=1 Tax=Mycena alexandri TaxID=1745969 RepID=A0AAD6TG38_9AGAR|nr:hypothetical protein C8F04DRAFT_1026045 [Mycena alexandri]
MNTQPNPPKRVEELWFEDGNIVLQAGDSHYRVYRGVLAARSPVFRDMLAFPQPADSELVDGCPLVRLPDCDIEVTFFLKAIFDPEFLRPFPSRTTFDILAGCLRLSHKYEVAGLRRLCLVHLSSGYDTELSRFDVATYYFDDKLPAWRITSWPWPSDSGDEIYIIQLFREVEATWLLPNAFYNLSYSAKELGRDIFHGTSFNDIPCNLSVEDQNSFVEGQAIQSHSAITDTLQFLADPLDIQGCKSPTECALERFKAIGEVRESVSDVSSDPLDVWRSDDWDLLADVCDVCLSVLKETHQAARQAFWDKLPGLYGLPPWDELEKMKVAAIGNSWLC